MQLKQELGTHIAVAEQEIRAALQKFYDDTGLVPQRIDFNMIDTSVMGEKRNVTVGTCELRAST